MLEVLAYLLVTLAAFPGVSSDVKLLTAKLEARYRSARTLQTTFLERYSENGQLLRSEAGVAYFRRPGKMRWEYEAPEKNLFLVDGKNAWFYVPADHTVTRAPAKQSEDWRTPLALLAGEMKLSRFCGRIEAAATEPPIDPRDVVLECQLRGQNVKQSTSRNAGDLQDQGRERTVYLEVAPDTGDLARVLVREKGEVSVDFKFGGWRFDPPLPDSFFRFGVPQGVAIVNGENPEEAKP
jgi:outer membrane lipoprotein carrier protein